MAPFLWESVEFYFHSSHDKVKRKTQSHKIGPNVSIPLQDKNQQQEASGFTGSSIAPCLSEAQLQLGPP